MHGSIRNRLEDLLAARGAAVTHQELGKHLSSCAECSTEVEAMAAQCEMLRSLRAPEEIEPAAGFYARVLQRIEERAKDSIWAVFLYPPFGKRLVYASLALALTLGTYVITQESRDGHLGGVRIVAQDSHEDPLVVGSQAQQRDAVLENFAAHPVLANYVNDGSREGSPQ
jgi:predicted anti-sigma-YlaC factor YlaD